MAMMYLIVFVVICVVAGFWMRHVNAQRINSQAKIMGSAIAEGKKAASTQCWHRLFFLPPQDYWTSRILFSMSRLDWL
jgi:uncharacterized membrane protein